MGSPKWAVITERASDLLSVWQQLDPDVAVLKPDDVPETDLDVFEAIAILGGVSNAPLLFSARQRVKVEEQIRKGKRVFAEYTGSIGHIYCEPPESTRFQRIAVCSGSSIEGLEAGMLLDDQCGSRIKPHSIACSHRVPLLQFAKLHAHDRVEWDDSFHAHVSDRALWFDDPDSLLVCSFRLCNFLRARYSPHERIVRVISFITEWLIGQPVRADQLRPAYALGPEGEAGFTEALAKRSADRGLQWFERAGILVEEGRSGVYEGLGTEIYPDGSQRQNRSRRADCIGEASLAYFLHGMLDADSRSAAVSERLQRYLFDYFQEKEPGPLFGMFRWTEEAWGVCYQDDVARAIIPQLLKCFYTGTSDDLEAAAAALQFLVGTTGSDGTRVFRTDNIHLSPERIAALRSEPGNLPCAHYNSYYYAALFLAYRLTGIQSFLDTGVKGMETLMSRYPDTVREQSETEEYCRLILPLSWLYWVTGEARHREWLYRVARDLQAMKHVSGAYLERDTGYMAQMRNEAGQGESSLLAKNGDPVADLLYSNNWLPIGFIQAYFVTKDEWFLALWRESASFFIHAQIRSDNEQIDGAWARGLDVELREVFGSPADVGWGPWSIESGWTVAEVVSGLYMGLLKEWLVSLYG